MKVEVKVEFYGIKEGRLHHVGEVLSVTPDRFEEMKEFVTKIKAEKAVEK